MTSIDRLIARASFRLLLLTLTLSILTFHQPVYSKETTIMEVASGIWQMVQALESQVPFRKAAVERLLGPIAPVQQEGYAPFEFYKGGPVALTDGNLIEDVDLRIGKGDRSAETFLVLKIKTESITISMIHRMYPDATLSQVPRGRSPNEEAFLSSTREWGKIKFGFTVDRPDYLSRIVFSPAD